MVASFQEVQSGMPIIDATMPRKWNNATPGNRLGTADWMWDKRKIGQDLIGPPVH